MKFLAYLRSLAERFLYRSHVEAEMEEELQAHMQHCADDLERSGLDRAEAERRARAEFGGYARFKEESREALAGNFLETSFGDVRHSIRRLRKSPAFTGVAVLTLALAIGANAVVFAVLDALVLRPLDVPKVDSLYVVGRADDKVGTESYPNYLDLRDRNRSFESLAASDFAQAGLDAGDGPTLSWGYKVSGNYFDVLGVRPYVGRFFSASDEHGPNSAPYVVITYAYWHTRFRDDRGVVGRTVLVNKHPFTITGVAPPNFRGTFPAYNTDFFVPMVNQEQVDGQSELNQRGKRWVSEVLGHLKPGVTPQQATADLNAVGAYLEKTYPKDEPRLQFALTHPGMADLFGGAVKAFVAGLMLLAGLILLAACANLGSLFAARAADRSREVALRLALGSSRLRILRELFTEAMLLSIAGGAAGLWGSVLLLRNLSAWQPFPEFPINMPVSPDVRIYGIALLLALASGFLFGMVPVRQVLRTDPYQIVKSGARATGGRRVTARDLLLAVQIAICAVLVTSSMVAVRGLARSLHSNFGFEPQNAMLVNTDVSRAGYRGDAVPAVQKRMLAAMQAIPGVTGVALVGPNPPLHMGWLNENVFPAHTSDLRPANAAADPVAYRVSPEYFQVAATPLVAGRVFSWHDDMGAPQVAIVNQEFARKVFGSPAGALGRSFKTEDGTRREVVGIVQDGKYTANVAEDPQAAMFLPILQSPWSETWLVVRSPLDPQELAAAIRGALRQVDAGLPAFVQTWGSEMNGALFASRMAALSLGVLGGMGALLSVTGIFGMAAYSVSKRLKELGIRMALGAQRRQLLQAALGKAFQVLGFGSAAGLVLGLLASRVLAAIVYSATPRDPLVMAGVVAAMAAVGLLATWVPAQRALSLDPARLLREE